MRRRLRPTLCIVVPVFNEERRLPPLLEKLTSEGDGVAAKAGLELVQVLVVDDGSTDRTPSLLDGFGGLPGRFGAMRLERNLGKGAAVRAGMIAANADVALMTDVDLSTPLEELEALAAAVAAGADVAIGSRALVGSRVLVRQPPYRELMGKAFNLGVRALTGVSWRDTQCGFKLFRLETTRLLFERQRTDGFAFDLELLLLARRLGLEVREVPVRWIDHRETHVGLVTSSAAMARDAVSIAYRDRCAARRGREPGAARSDRDS